MTAKQTYEVGDTVWVYGITLQNKLTKGRVVHTVDIPGYAFTYYVIAIPTEIEDLLELRTWHNISQDEHGPSGALRTLGENSEGTKKFLRKTGIVIDMIEEDEPTEAEIHAALEKSRVSVQHQPLVLKENKPKRRSFPRKKKQ